MMMHVPSCKFAAIAILAAHAAGVPCLVKAAEAPFGLVWSQKRETLPRPSSAVADANIIELIYEGAALPPPAKDAQTIGLKVCDGYGLQQVRWVSRPFTLAEATKKFFAAYAEGVRRHGESDEGNVSDGTAGWSREGIGVLIERAEQEGYRPVMISDGPQFARSKSEYQQITGHE
jgi:hypothetical protein